MDGVREFLEMLRSKNLVKGRFRGMLHVLIGRTIRRADNSVVSTGITWRELSNLLKLLRWDKEQVREIGLNPDALPPRDRQRYWYTAIAQAQITSEEARAEGDEIAAAVASHGYSIDPR